MNRELFYLGLTHQSAPLAIREQIRADHDTQRLLLSELSQFAEGRLVLSTCERFEVYSMTARTNPAEWLRILSSWIRIPVDVVRRFAQVKSGPAAAEHLLRVSAGLESRILGERQILGQVRNAFRFALEQESLDAQLAMLTRTAIRAGKRVRQETKLGGGSRSIVTIAMDWLTDKHGGLTDKVIGVVGSGRLAALAVAEVVQRRPRQVVVAGRNEARAAEIARRFDANCVGMNALARAVAAMDVVITCTASPSYLIDAALIGAVRATPLLLVDLSVPRNVDPAVALLPGVTLGHLDEMVTRELGTGHAADNAPRWDVIKQAEQLVQEELQSFLQWRRERQAAPMIAELFRRATENAIGKRALHDQVMRLKAGFAV